MTGVEDLATEQLLDRAGLGDTQAVERLLADHRPRLKRMVQARMNRALAGRVDPSDVVQEALVAAATQLPEYVEQLSTREIAAVVGIAERSVRSGHRRAMERIGALLENPQAEE